jgi:hypothetical protein
VNNNLLDCGLSTPGFFTSQLATRSRLRLVLKSWRWI